MIANPPGDTSDTLIWLFSFAMSILCEQRLEESGVGEEEERKEERKRKERKNERTNKKNASLASSTSSLFI